MNRINHHVLAVLLIGASPNLRAATFSDDNWTSMSGYPGANGPVNVTVVDGSGNLYIGGSFNVVSGVPASRIAKWNGTHWSALGAGLQGSNGWAAVYALAVSGSDVYAAGRFTSAGGVPANNIAKWNGTNWSALGAGIGGSNGSVAYVFALAASGNDVYAAGYFTTAGGSPANQIAKWNGSSWSALGAGPPNAIMQVNAALVVSGSDLYVGTESGVAKWDGSSWSALGSGMNYGVRALAVSGSDVYAAVYPTNVFKWNGSSWSALASPVGSGIAYPWTLTVSGGDLYAGGNLITYYTSNSFGYRAYVAKWTGNSWLELGSGITQEWGESWDPRVYALAVLGSNVFVGGAFRDAGDVTAYCIAKWNGTRWSALDSTYRSLAAVTASGRDVYGAGIFAASDGTQSNAVAKWNGHDWSALGAQFLGDNPFAVSVLAVSGRDVYAGGSFTNAGGTPANSIARWNGTNWSALGSGLGWPNYYESTVHALAVSGHDLYVGGHFSMASGIAANNIAKWNGTNWSALGSGIGPWLDGGPAWVYALAVLGSNLYAGGIFTAAGGSPANYIAKWDGNNWSALGSGMGGSGSAPAYVTALAMLGDDLYAGGFFATAGGITVRCVAKWNGSSWSDLRYGMTAGGWTPGGEPNSTPYVYALAVSGSDLYVGGIFNTTGNANANYVAKWNGNSWSPLGSGMNYGVRLLAATGDELFAAGWFTTAGGKVAPSMARARIGSKAQGVTASNSTASIRFSGVTGYPYDVQRATNLTAPVAWTTVSGVPLYPAADGSFTFTDNDAPRGTVFYRAAGPGPAACPKLDVQQPAGTNLTNGISIGFGAVAVGSSVSKTFTITNSGNYVLSIAEVYMDGEFAVDSAGMFTSVLPGDSTTFTVTFSPAAAGNYAEGLYVSTFGVEGCNDGEGDWFTITLTGTGL